MRRGGCGVGVYNVCMCEVRGFIWEEVGVVCGVKTHMSSPHFKMDQVF